jgi:hypothetical protein
MPTLHLPNHQSFVAIDRYREQSAAGNARVEFKRYEEFHNSDSDEEEGEETPMEKKDSAEDKTAATSDFTNVAAENTAKTLDPVESDSHNQRAQIRQTPMATEKCTASKEIGEGFQIATFYL